MERMERNLVIRIPTTLVAALDEHRARTLISTSAFVRRAIEEALQPGVGGLDHKLGVEKQLAL